MKKPENHTINRFLVTIDMLESQGGRKPAVPLIFIIIKKLRLGY